MLKTSAYWVRYENRKRRFFLSTEGIVALEYVPAPDGDERGAIAITVNSGATFVMEAPYADAFADWWWATKLEYGYKVADLDLP
jgi:hypothetical protein